MALNETWDEWRADQKSKAAAYKRHTDPAGPSFEQQLQAQRDRMAWIHNTATTKKDPA